jgi:hypothetical protein
MMSGSAVGGKCVSLNDSCNEAFEKPKSYVGIVRIFHYRTWESDDDVFEIWARVKLPGASYLTVLYIVKARFYRQQNQNDGGGIIIINSSNHFHLLHSNSRRTHPH